MEQGIGVAEPYHRDIRRAVEILTDVGCRQIYLFGSLAEGQVHAGSDIDLAIRGCPKGQFFHVLGRLMLELEHPVDLVNLDRQDALARHLEQEGALIRLG